MEEPDEVSAHLDEAVVVFLAGDGVIVEACVAGGDAVKQLLFPQEPHGPLDLLVGALAAPGIGSGFVALQRDGRNKVFHPQHIICKFFVDQGAVGEAEENTVGVLFADPDQILFSDKRLAAGIDVHVHA